MANVKKGNLVPPPQWRKHLKKHMHNGAVGWKRVFWKRERQAQNKRIRNENQVRSDGSRT